MVDNEPEQFENDAQGDEKSEDFAAMFEASEKEREIRPQRDRQVEGQIVSIGEEWVFVDVGGKSEGVISREEFTNENGELTLKIGDPIKAYVVGGSGEEMRLSVKMTSAASDDALYEASSAGIPVEGAVTGERKGGYTVTIFGNSAFCPFSQMDIHPGVPLDYIGRRLTFKIMEFSNRGRNIVVSRREILEAERREKVEALKQILKPGDVISGVVHRLAQFGAFVDIGGIDGLIPISELAWFRVKQPSDIVNPGDVISVKVLDTNWERNRISLSLKQTYEDPWMSVQTKYYEGDVLTGKVMRLLNFGAFVEIEPGVEGLIHISQFGMGRKIKHPQEAVSEGDTVEVRVVSVDPHAKRIALELVNDVGAESEPEREFTVGDVVTGEVESVKEYGVFVNLGGSKSGLLHVSEMSDSKSSDLKQKYHPGSTVKVQIIGIDSSTGKIALSAKAMKHKAEESQFKDFDSQQFAKTTFGTLGDLLKDKLHK